MPDPWAEFHLEDVETEPSIRYRSVVALVALHEITLFNELFSIMRVCVTEA